MAAEVLVTSFGFLHGAPPVAHVLVDLRSHFHDPHVDPALQHMSADDEPLREAVLGTPGIPALVAALEGAVAAFLIGPSGGVVRVAVGCAGGRHRAATVAVVLADALRPMATVTLAHRDIDKPVVERETDR